MTMTDMTDEEVRAAFLRAAGVTDHPYSRTPLPCCTVDPSRHLGYGKNPWTLPPVAEMRDILKERVRP